MTGRSTGPSVLVVEDDDATRRALETAFAGHGFGVRGAASGTDALRAWELRRPDLVLLDLGLPDLDGTEVVRRIRRDASTPILVLSARDREQDKVAALDLGADDYLTKPFGMAELWARVGAVLRRAAGPAAAPDGVVRIGTLALDPARHRVTVDERDVALTPREFEVLRVLVSFSGRVVTRGRLLRAVWGAAYGDESHYLHVYVSQIRRRIAAVDPEGRLAGLIEAEPGLGYRIAIPEQGAAEDLSES